MVTWVFVFAYALATSWVRSVIEPLEFCVDFTLFKCHFPFSLFLRQERDMLAAEGYISALTGGFSRIADERFWRRSLEPFS